MPDDKLRCKTVCYKLKVDFKVYRAVKTYSKTMVSEFFSSDVFFAIFFLISCYAYHVISINRHHTFTSSFVLK